MRISKIIKGSIADEIGIAIGDVLLSINDVEISDMLDYGYYTIEDDLVLTIKKQDNEIWEYEIEKEDEELGMVFDENIEDNTRCCSNRCIFCFIDQLPKGMRKTLYFKDDDTRMSFLHGNYVTLTNTKDKDIEKIIKYRLSPINVSIHTTNPELRRLMMGNMNAGSVLDILKKLVKNNIEINCQIVLCKGLNDGEELVKTITDLLNLGIHMHSISVVPVGITKYREGLYHIEELSEDDSLKVIEMILKYQKEMYEKAGTRKIYLADEFYLKANQNLPEYCEYEDFPQIENGVGMMRSFYDEAKEHIKKIDTNINFVKKTTIATGELAYKYINELVDKIKEKLPNYDIQVVKIKNEFFGRTVGVAGLLTGSDIINQLKNIKLGSTLYISKNMLRSGENVLLDDITTDMIENELKVSIKAVKSDGNCFVKEIIKI